MAQLGSRLSPSMSEVEEAGPTWDREMHSQLLSWPHAHNLTMWYTEAHTILT